MSFYSVYSSEDSPVVEQPLNQLEEKTADNPYENSYSSYATAEDVSLAAEISPSQPEPPSSAALQARARVLAASAAAARGAVQTGEITFDREFSIGQSASDSFSDPPEDLDALVKEDYQWQARFEAILSLPTASAKEKLEKSRQLRNLNQHFLTVAAKIGRQIIAEIGLPEEKKRFPSLSGKGIAGGEKFTAAQIFFKLTRDSAGIYGGDYGASKAAKHEIRSLQHLIQCNIPDLYFPLMGILDFLGFRMVCISFIDGIGNNSLVYGSQNAGKSIFTSDARMNRKIQDICDVLHIKGHYSIDSSKKAHFIYGPVDLEGHIIKQPETGKEKFYVLDFARLFPPESIHSLPEGAILHGFSIPANLEIPVHPVETPLSAMKFTQQELLEELYIWNFPHDRPPTLINSENRLDFDQRHERELNEQYQVNDRNTSRRIDYQKACNEAVEAGNSMDSVEIPLYEPEYQFSGFRQSLPCQLKWLSRSEGLLCYNALSIDQYNTRASAIGNCIIHGTAIICQNTGAIFFRLLRPELLLRSPFSISSDCFSGFGCCPQCRSSICPHSGYSNHLDSSAITEALVIGRSSAITQLANSLNERILSPTDSLEIVKEMHKAGINIRHMGRLRDQVEIPYLRDSLLVEMISRSIRQVLTGLLRAASKTSFLIPKPSMENPKQSEASQAGNHAYDNVEISADSSSESRPGLRRAASIKTNYSEPQAFYSQYESGLLYPVPVHAVAEEKENSSESSESAPAGGENILATNSGAFPLVDEGEIKSKLNRWKGENHQENSAEAPKEGGVKSSCFLHSLSHAHVTIRLFNLVFGNSSLSHRFWCGAGAAGNFPAPSVESSESSESKSPEISKNVAVLLKILTEGTGGELRACLTRKFQSALNAVESQLSFDLRTKVLKFPLFMRLQAVTGVKFKKSAIERMFRAPEKEFECENPFSLEDFEGFQVKTRGIESDESMNQLLYDYSIEKAQQNSSAPAGASAAAVVGNSSNGAVAEGREDFMENSIRDIYHQAALSVLGNSHPLVINSSLKRSSNFTQKSLYQESFQEISSALKESENLYGQFSIPYVLALIAMGEMRMEEIQRSQENLGKSVKPAGGAVAMAEENNAEWANNTSIDGAIEAFSSALFATERLHSLHPLIARLSAYLGRLHLLKGSKPLGCHYLAYSQSIYMEFYGLSISNYLGPFISLGKTAEIIQILGDLALSMKPYIIDLYQSGRFQRNSMKSFESQYHKELSGEWNSSSGHSNENSPYHNKHYIKLSRYIGRCLKDEEMIHPLLIWRQYQQLKKTIGLLEEMNGLERGFYIGKSLEIDWKTLKRTRKLRNSEESGENNQQAEEEGEGEDDDFDPESSPSEGDHNPTYYLNYLYSSAHRLSNITRLKQFLTQQKENQQENRNYMKLTPKSEWIFGFNRDTASCEKINRFFIRSYQNKMPQCLILPPEHEKFPYAMKNPMIPFISKVESQENLYEILFSSSVSGPHLVEFQLYEEARMNFPSVPIKRELTIEFDAGEISAPHCEFSGCLIEKTEDFHTNSTYEVFIDLFDSNKNRVRGARVENFLKVFKQSSESSTNFNKPDFDWFSHFELRFNLNQAAVGVDKAALSRVDAQQGRLIYQWQPTRDAYYTFSIHYTDKQLYRKSFKVSAPAGQGFCRMPVGFGAIGGAVAQYCAKCGPRLKSQCYMCKGRINFSNAFARWCQGCSMKRRCIDCTQIISGGHALNTFQVQICNICSNKPQLCTGRI